MNSELRVRLEQLAPVRDMIPARSSSASLVQIVLRCVGVMDQPISIFRRLFNDGASARAAKDAIDGLASHGRVVCGVPSDIDFDVLARDLGAMNVQVLRPRSYADPAAFIVEVRTRHGLSQRAFADALGLDVRTLQNWEQGRNRPDSAVLSLIRLFDRDPKLVEDAAFEPAGEPVSELVG